MDVFSLSSAMRQGPASFLLSDENLPYVLSTVFVLVNLVLLRSLTSTNRNASDLRAVQTKDGQDPTSGEIVVKQIFIHPIKSCKGISVQESRYTADGLENDRAWMIIDAYTHKFITAREKPGMVLINIDVSSSKNQLRVSFPSSTTLAGFTIPLHPTKEESADWDYITDVGFWDKKTLDGHVFPQYTNTSTPSPSEQLSQYLGTPVLLVFKGPVTRHLNPTRVFPELEGQAVFQDGYPLFFATEDSLKDLEREVREMGKEVAGKEGKEKKGFDEVMWKDKPLNMERFRPNIVLGGTAGPWVEDYWTEVAIGDLATDGGKISVVSKGDRCLLTNVDTTTGIPDAAVPYKVLTRFRRDGYKVCFGMNMVPKRREGGVIRVGDRVVVTQALNEPQKL